MPLERMDFPQGIFFNLFILTGGPKIPLLSIELRTFYFVLGKRYLS